MSGNSNTLQGVRKYGKSDHLQLLIEMYGGDITMGLEGSYPTRRPMSVEITSSQARWN